MPTYSEIGATVTVDSGGSEPTVQWIDMGEYYYFVLLFTNAGKTDTIRFDKATTAEILIVGGGSDGMYGLQKSSGNAGNGGNGGEVKVISSHEVTANRSYEIKVGTNTGNGDPNYSDRTSGQSSFESYTANGGTAPSGKDYNDGTGGNSYGNLDGKSKVGNPNIEYGGDGASGTQYSIEGTVIGNYGAGGGGGSKIYGQHSITSFGKGGTGAGHGGYCTADSSNKVSSTTKATNASPNSGGGGGGGFAPPLNPSYNNTSEMHGGTGGSGIVIVSIRVEGRTPSETEKANNVNNILSTANDMNVNLRELHQMSGTNADSANQLYLATMVGGTFWMVLATAMIYYTFTEL